MTVASPAPPVRLPDWPARLGVATAAWLSRPFAWGPADCAVWVADAVHSMHGCDTLVELRQPPRSTARQAARAVRRGGGYAACMARAGLAAVAPALAQRGDVVLLRHGGPQPVLGVCLGEHAAAPGAQGLQTVPMAQAVAAWRV